MSKFDGFIKAARGAAEPKRKAARPAGKSSPAAAERRRAKRDDPDYKQSLAYVPRDLHRRVMSKLAEEEREFSDLIEQLLARWLKENS
ncbi:MAG: hypothetical protein M3371_14755 [Acidobacteriota bacterium]|nr:hypothetical protein [Acidobacteriota bacterium]